MLHDLIVSKSVLISAPKEKVWDALTNPAIIKEYLFGTETITDWKIGSELVFQGEYQGKKYRDKGVILENAPLSKIVYSYWTGFSGLDDKPENYSLITYEITDKGDNKTELTWIQKGFANEDGYKHSLNGMDAFLNNIKSIIEG